MDVEVKGETRSEVAVEFHLFNDEFDCVVDKLPTVVLLGRISLITLT